MRKFKVLFIVALLLCVALAQAQTDPEVLKELAFLQSKGYFNLPEDHLLNGVPVSRWKNFIANLPENSAAGGRVAAGERVAAGRAASGASRGIVTRVMTAGPGRGVIPQTIAATLGVIFIHDFILEMSKLNEDGTLKERPAYFEQYPDAYEPWLFRFTAPAANRPAYTRTYETSRYGLQPDAYTIDPYSLPGVQRNPDRYPR